MNEEDTRFLTLNHTFTLPLKQKVYLFSHQHPNQTSRMPYRQDNVGLGKEK